MKKNIFISITILAVGFFCLNRVQAASVHISSLKELVYYAHESNNNVKLKPGIYRLTDYLTPDSIEAKLNRKDTTFMD